MAGWDGPGGVRRGKGRDELKHATGDPGWHGFEGRGGGSGPCRATAPVPVLRAGQGTGQQNTRAAEPFKPTHGGAILSVHSI